MRDGVLSVECVVVTPRGGSLVVLVEVVGPRPPRVERRRHPGRGFVEPVAVRVSQTGREHRGTERTCSIATPETDDPRRHGNVPFTSRRVDDDVRGASNTDDRVAPELDEALTRNRFAVSRAFRRTGSVPEVSLVPNGLDKMGSGQYCLVL